ncbi:hypothetical protein [Herbaspirillum huttiense]|uniref:hypothetical protein n=1 Tax=Herbaspirillum huttiense TaxID=863372 RepID=UPI0031DEDAA9
MIGALLLLAIFALLGYSWSSGRRGGLLLAPAVGLASVVLLSYFLSANFDLTGAAAVAVALPLLASVLLVREWRLRETFSQRYAFLRADLRDAGLALLPLLLLIVPALHQGVSDFFGVGNFDFFYNSQDGWYLSSHSVNQYAADVYDRILPLTWSANVQGRFAVTLLSAFAYKYLDLNTLHFNAVLLTTCVATLCLAAYAFASSMLNLSARWATGAVFALICSAGFAQGYSYFLLGQLSAIPLFLALALSFKPLLEWSQAFPSDNGNVGWRHVAVIAFWLNALYVFYAILAFFGAALFVLSVMFNTIGRLANWKIGLVRIGKVVALTLLLFVLLRSFSLPAAAQAIVDWINLSLKTAGSSVDGPKVFTEYLTEGFLALLLGLVRYPSVQSVFGALLVWEGSSSKALLALSAVGIISFLVALSFFARAKNIPRAGKATLGALCAMSLACAAVFFVTGSGYAIFKIGSWFIPICLMAVVAALSLSNRLSGVKRWLLTLACLVLVVSNLLAAFNYTFAFLPLRKLFGYRENASMVEAADVETFRHWLATQPHKQVDLDFLDGIKAAWFANELRDMPVDVMAYSHNLQPLADRKLGVPVCAVPSSTAFDDVLLVSEHLPGDGQDVISRMQPSPAVTFSSGKYHALEMSKLDLYASLGRGTYPSYSLSDSEMRNNQLPRTLRWVEGGFELYVYTRRAGYVDVSMDAAPGFMNGPPVRTLTLNAGSASQQQTFTKDRHQVSYTRVPVSAGLNCFHIESTDDVRQITRYGALFREAVMVESRFLNFAIGNLAIHYYE